MPTELELIALETEFDLYLPFSKRLVLNLPDSQDRARAAQWLMKLRSITDNNSKKLRNEHLKLLLFALHRRSMVGIFEKRPPKDELESFHDGLTLLEMTRELIEITEKQKMAGVSKDLAPGECPLPKVFANFSSDLKEYTASQNIPKFGAHVFYAVSNEPIQFWAKSPQGEYPGMGDIPNSMQWEQMLRKLSDHVLEKQAELDRKIELQKAIEAGDASPDDLEDKIDFNKKISVPSCPKSLFKWKKDSLLQLYQNYDFTNVHNAEDVETQGKAQLESDEEAFTLLDYSLPGRRRINVRDPFFEGLPHDIASRRHHGVQEEIPYPEEDDNSDECDVCSCEEEDENVCGDTCPCDDPCEPSPSTPPPPPPCPCEPQPCGQKTPNNSLTRQKSQESLGKKRKHIQFDEAELKVYQLDKNDDFNNLESSTNLCQPVDRGSLDGSQASRSKGSVCRSRGSLDRGAQSQMDQLASMSRSLTTSSIDRSRPSACGQMDDPCGGSKPQSPKSPAKSSSVCFADKLEKEPPKSPCAVKMEPSQRKKPKSKNLFCRKIEPKYQDPCNPPRSCRNMKVAVPTEDPCLRRSCKPPMRVPNDPLYRTGGGTCCGPIELPPPPVNECRPQCDPPICEDLPELSEEPCSFSDEKQDLSYRKSLDPESECSCNDCQMKSESKTNQCAPPKAAASPPPKAAACPPPKAAACLPPKAAACPPPKPAACPPPKPAACPPPKPAACPPPQAAPCPPPQAAPCPPPQAMSSTSRTESCGCADCRPKQTESLKNMPSQETSNYGSMFLCNSCKPKPSPIQENVTVDMTRLQKEESCNCSMCNNMKSLSNQTKQPMNSPVPVSTSPSCSSSFGENMVTQKENEIYSTPVQPNHECVHNRKPDGLRNDSFINNGDYLLPYQNNSNPQYLGQQGLSESQQSYSRHNEQVNTNNWYNQQPESYVSTNPGQTNYHTGHQLQSQVEYNYIPNYSGGSRKLQRRCNISFNGESFP